MAVSTKVTALHRIEAGLYDLLMGHFARMPIDKASAAGAAWARALGPLIPTHQTALKNLRMAYPGETETWRDEVAREMWAEMGRWAAEFPHLNEISFAPGNGRAELIGGEHLEAVRASGKGAVLIGGHFANFEMLMVTIVQSGLRWLMTYRPLNNPIIDKRVLATRLSCGVTTPASKGIEGGVGLLRGLARGDCIGVMNDQKYNEGVAAPFFGYNAMTADGPTRMALRFGVPLVPLHVRRTDKQKVRFTVQAYPPIPIDKSLPQEHAILDTVTRINEWMEARVREAPEQWWWMHNRWSKDAWKKAGVE